jgi:hypothetical protein
VSVAESLDTATAAGRLVLNIMVSVSQWEREAIGERTRDAMAHKRANGRRVGTIPFGFRIAGDGRNQEEGPAEQDILARIPELKAAGQTTRQIADELNRQGYVTPPRGRRGGSSTWPRCCVRPHREVEVKKRTAKPKKASKQDQAWFEQRVAELGAKLNKPPAARQAQLEQELRSGSKR